MCLLLLRLLLLTLPGAGGITIMCPTTFHQHSTSSLTPIACRCMCSVLWHAAVHPGVSCNASCHILDVSEALRHQELAAAAAAQCSGRHRNTRPNSISHKICHALTAQQQQ
jgi:hypothetical protein